MTTDDHRCRACKCGLPRTEAGDSDALPLCPNGGRRVGVRWGWQVDGLLVWTHSGFSLLRSDRNIFMQRATTRQSAPADTKRGGGLITDTAGLTTLGSAQPTASS